MPLSIAPRRAHAPVPLRRLVPSLLACAGIAAAADAGPAPPVSELPVLVVTAAGTETSTLETPATVNTVTAQRAADNRAGWIGETLNQVPGVHFAALRGITDAPAIRLPLTYSNYYLYLQDGVPLQPTISYNHAAFAYSAAMTSDGGMEVLKGPGTALYGSDAVAAVIDVKSREPTSAPEGRLRLGGGSDGYREFRAEASDALSYTQTARLAVAYDGEDGWRDNTAWRRLQGVLRHRYVAGTTRIDTILLATRYDAEMAGYLDKETLEHHPGSDGLQPGVDRSEARDGATYLRLSSAIRHDIGEHLRLEATPYVRRVDDQYIEVWNPDTTPLDRDLTDTIGSADRLRWQGWPGGELVVGTDVEWTRKHYLSTQSRPTVTGIWGYLTSYQGAHYDYDVDYLNLAPYLQVRQLLGERWVVVAGARYDRTSYDYSDNLGPATDPVDFVYRPGDRRDSFHQFSPKLGLTWLIDDQQALFGRYAHGFRIPMSSSLYELGNGQTGFTLKPETFDSFELGWKGQVDDYASWEVDSYWMEARNGIVDGVVTPAGTISANGGRRRFRGIEAGTELRPGAGFELGASWSHSFNRIVRQLADGSSTADGKVPANAPENLGDLRCAWRPPTLPALRVEIEGSWLGRWWMDDLNTKRTPDVVLWNLRASWRLSPRWSIDGKVLNLLDERYAATAESFSYGDLYRPGAPLTAAAGMEGTF